MCIRDSSNYERQPLSHKNLQDIVYQINMNDGEKSNIKEFYNIVFLQNDDLKQFITTQKQMLDSQQQNSNQNEKKKFFFETSKTFKKSNSNNSYNKFQTPQLRISENFMTPRQMALKSSDEFDSPANSNYSKKLKIQGFRQEQQILNEKNYDETQSQSSQEQIGNNRQIKNLFNKIAKKHSTDSSKQLFIRKNQSFSLSNSQNASIIQELEEKQFSNSQSEKDQLQTISSLSNLESIEKKIDKSENKVLTQFSIFKDINKSQN
eukprot:TRINITY_DN9106_c0_g1_i3.p1 TRINITY_DN9106_c0_g1~~TRINITY_DN9106_c0_g1_i3.p1  ORF type:complete len:304 (-),score=41.54 TRINITY_DN9106_c0_g1_i3:90-878(-)